MHTGQTYTVTHKKTEAAPHRRQPPFYVLSPLPALPGAWLGLARPSLDRVYRSSQTRHAKPAFYDASFSSAALALASRSKRSRFMTLVQAATKSWTNFSCRRRAGVDFGQGPELRVGAEDEVDAGGGPLQLAGGAVAAFEDVRVGRRRLPLRAHVEQVDEEVVGQRLRPVGEDAVLRLPPSLALSTRRPPTSTVISGAVRVSSCALSTSSARPGSTTCP